ncbi:VCBS repeat-containing protein [Chryseolinea sp. H1M3-3]|uniref:VCBS repeat-containing protein n=1 Tax=Chryseolinea sp. H1M3-3 TaxID=3034144 RepID=UPI0023EAB998|nr:VCBS repeat-containing protein [Chryseolinea sp. H1M3-3]
MKVVLKFSILIFIAIVGVIFFQCTSDKKQFTELFAEQTGLNFRNDIEETQHTNILTYEYTYNGAGIAAGDINNDGLTDLYFSGNSVSNKLYLNKGAWKFEDVTATTKTEGRKGWKTGVTMADINGDGWLDIYVCYSGNAPGEGYNLPIVKDYPGRANQLFINNRCEPGGVPTFTERAKEYGLDAIGIFSTQAYFFDYDLDNDLDMFLVNHANMFYTAFFNTRRLRNLRHPYFGNKLFRNDSRIGTTEIKFTEVSEKAGFHGSGLNFGLSAAISDLNFDNWPDIYVTNDYEEQDFCYINNRDGTFKEVSHKLFGHLSKFGMGSDIADMNNDGLQEILVLDMLPEDNYRQKLLKGPDEYDRYKLAVDSGYHHQYMRNTLQLNRGFADDSLPRFSEVGQLAGVSNTDWSWSPFFVDIDSDGLKDIFVTNGYLRDFTNLDFMKYTSTVYNEAKVANKTVDYLNLIQQLPVTRLNNYLYKNKNGIEFENMSEQWGLTQRHVSNGAIYADLDNDGDHDLVTNNLNDQITVLRNNQNEIQKNSFIKIKLKGRVPNTFGVGAKIYVTTDSAEIFQEAFFTRGYASSVAPDLTIGIGRSSRLKAIKVIWPDGSQSIVTDASPNQTIIIDQGKSESVGKKTRAVPDPVVLNDVTKNSGLDFKHVENKFIDFKMQRLLYYQLSQLGGTLATGDVNKDGSDDIFLGGASGQASRLFLGHDDGTFTPAESQPWEQEVAFEDVNALFFDADGDEDQDLYIVSGGSEFIAGAPLYQDRLYANDGKGNFSKATNAIPQETSSGSCVTAADFDKDGDLDLFVGGRHVPAKYAVIPTSFILQNDSKNGVIKFSNVTNKINPDIGNVGMVTASVWTDFNNDSWPDLIVVGEWMPIRIFKNEKGKLIEQKDLINTDKTHGWWCSIYPADIDNDGDMDYFLGNAGTNLQFKASEKEPVQLNVGDFNQDGTLDPLLSYFIKGTSYPLASRDEVLDQISSLRKKFIKYEDYAKATVDDIASKEQLGKSYKFNAYVLKSCWLENVGGKFTLKPLPLLAQLSSINGFIHEDFDGDGKKELLVAGNFFPFKPQLGRSDASTGILLAYRNGNIVAATNSSRSNVWLTGDIRDMALLNFKTGKKRVIISRNNDRAGLFDFVKH